jgi:cation diffusion facilitator CzcD-associated flavoprotein CzcO
MSIVSGKTTVAAKSDAPATTADWTTTVAIIGSGFSGICMAFRLQEKGIPYVILEKEREVGGTWRDNVYPGAACDTQSHHYSFSFWRNPAWSRKFAEQPEILEYLKSCATETGIRRNITFGAEVAAAEFVEGAGEWRITINDGRILRARYLVSAVGQLNRPSMPEVRGLETFKGKVLHTARWDRGYDLTGKTVAVIGTGASAVQLVPAIVDKVKKLTVIQRSPNWVTSKSDRPFTASELKWFRRIPLITNIYRRWVYFRREITWPEFLTGSKAAKRAEADVLNILKNVVSDADLRRKLTPDYPIGCKRVLLSNDYYPALQRPNARLVASGIDHIEEEAIVTTDGERIPADVIAFATGFRATEFLMPMTIRGRGGRDLHDAWKAGAEAYLGITVPGFPNLFLLYGPNTNLGHASIIFMIECQVNYIMKCLSFMLPKGKRLIEVRPDALARFLRRLDAEMAKTAWVASCASWYKTASGRVVNNWSTGTAKYWLRTKRPNFRDYDIA